MIKKFYQITNTFKRSFNLTGRTNLVLPVFIFSTYLCGMYTYRIPNIVKKAYPSCLWSFSRRSNKVYFTFDDGPHPNTTPQVLKMLRDNKVKGTFFCVGENVKKYPELFQQIIDEGHRVGNHTYNHLNGMKTNSSDYLENVSKAHKLIQSDLFRPPYGRIKRSQITKIKKDYKIVMWSLLVGDWDQSHTKEQCFFVLKNRLKGGDVIVLHDSEKAYDRMIFTLERGIEYAKLKGFEIEVL